MLSESRFGSHFRVSEPLGHLGIFDCSEEPTPADGGRDSAQSVPSSIEVSAETKPGEKGDTDGTTTGGCC